MRLADEARSAKNRAKRLKKKDKRKTKSVTAASSKSKPSINGSSAAGAGGEEGSSNSDSDEDGEGRQKKRRVLASGAPGSVVFRGKDEREQDDDQPREEEVRVKRIEQAISGNGSGEAGDGQEVSAAAAPTIQPQGISIVDED